MAEGCKLKKAKRKKKKDNACEIDANLNTGSSILSENENINSPMKLEERNDETETSKTRTLSNGLTIEELTPGEKDGKVATVGRKVSSSFALCSHMPLLFLFIHKKLKTELCAYMQNDPGQSFLHCKAKG